MPAAHATCLLVMAKEPVAGRAKTRLCPPCTGAEAAAIAEAALVDTLAAVARCGAERRVLALDGSPGAWLEAGFEVIPQRGHRFDERLANAWADAGGPGLQIGMDTPQVTPELLDDSLAALLEPGVDAVLGDAFDGGWWAIGLRRPDPRVFLDVPMSRPHTSREQRRRLRALDLHTTDLPVLHDMDHFADAVELAAALPGSRTAAAVHHVAHRTER